MSPPRPLFFRFPKLLYFHCCLHPGSEFSQLLAVFLVALETFYSSKIALLSQIVQRKSRSRIDILALFVAFCSAMEHHSSILESVCRIGGQKLASASHKTPYPVKNYVEEIAKVFKIDVSKDSPDVHPQYMCSLCQFAIARSMRDDTYKYCSGGCNGPVTWQPHTRSNCAVCKSDAVRAKGGRPPKRKAVSELRGQAAKRQTSTASTSAELPEGSPSSQQRRTSSSSSGDTNTIAHTTDSQTSAVTLDEISAHAAPMYRAEAALEKERFIDSGAVQECMICLQVVNGAVQAKCCENIFCSTCVHTWMKSHNTCPVCRQPMALATLQKPCKLVCNMVSKWGVHCDFHEPALSGCPATVRLHELRGHVTSCPFNPSTSSGTPIRTATKAATVEEILAASPSKLRGDVSDRLTCHLVSAKAEDGRLEVKTSSQGRPQVFMRTTVGSKQPEEASARTLKRRSLEMERITETVCTTADATRHGVAGLGATSIKPPSGTALAIKADLSLPWAQLRKLRRWLRSFGVQLESERSIRSFIATTLPKYTVKQLPFVKRTGELSLAAAVYFPNLTDIIIHYLDILDSGSKLTWHDGAIPETEIWVKLGGDHGKTTFKFVMQIANTMHPNSLANTVPICVFAEKDLPANLETALSMYRNQIAELQGQKWKGKTIVPYLFGDYEYQTMNYGLSGSSGVRPCLHCLCTKKDMQVPPANRDVQYGARSLEKMAEDYAQFTSAGALLSKAKLYNNTIRPVLLPVPVASAIIPVLHLDLGVFPWIFDVFTREVRLLDMQLAEQCDAEEQDSGRFRALSTANHKLSGCKTAFSEATAKATALENHLHFIVLFGQQQGMAIEALAGVLQREVEQAQADTEQCSSQLKIAEDELAKLRRSKDVLGPCEASIEPVLQKNIIHRQAYHGGAFVGNHIHRALKPAVITAITEAPAIVIGDRCPALRNDAQVVSERYKSLFSQYAACRSSFSHCNKCGEEELQQLELSIASFLQKCRSEVVERGLGHITPKLHLLEEHTVPLMRRVHVGLGLLSEQGAEGIHAEFNLLEKRYGSIPGELERLHAVAEQHLVCTLPDVADQRPKVRSRQRTAPSQADQPASPP
eukprot:scpid26618/ scgid24343/ E3 ubiquitin-protein ligase NRDP1; RING finger protein 41